jgi:hypothetical protein
MPFVQTNVNYASEYSRALAQQYPYLSYFAALLAANNSNLYKSGMGKTMYIPSLEVSGARAVNRDQITGTFNRNWNNEYQAVTLDMDREWDTLVDPLDIVETDDVATIANITRAFNEMQKIPEMDAYIAAKLFSFVTTPDTTALTAANILEKWDTYLAAMTDARVNRDRVEAYMTPAVYKLLKEAAGITRFVSTDEGYRGIDRNVARLDGVRITEVPSDVMKSSYVFTEGFAPASGARQINMILVDPMAVAVPVKYETSMMSAPTAQSKGKYLYYERYYYGAFALNKRKAGIMVNADAAT